MAKKIEELNDDELTKRLCDIEEGLSEWEVRFVDDLRRQWAYKQWISKKQREIALRIANKHL